MFEFRCCSCGREQEEKKKHGKVWSWKHKKITFRQYLACKLNKHDCYWR